MAPGPRRSSVLLVGAALTLIDLSDNVTRLLLIAQGRFDEPHLLDLPGVALRTLLFAALAVQLLREERRTTDQVLRRGLRGYLMAIAIAVASAPLAFALEGPTPGPDGAVTAAWDLALPLLLVYALLRHQLFDIDLKVKWTIRQSTLAAAFIGVFFVVSEGAQQFLADDQGGLGFGPYLGIAATGLLVFALAPLQQAAERVANAALPNTRSPEQMTRDERCTVYRQQAALAWADGTLSLDERQLLDGLRQHLHLSPDEAAQLEGEVTRGLRRRPA